MRTTADFGPRAHQLPGPEALDVFTSRKPPRPIRQSANRNIARLGRNVLVRWFPPTNPTVKCSLPTTEEGMWDLVDVTQRHLKAYVDRSEGNLIVPSHRMFVGANPARPDRRAIISIVERVSGREVNYSTSRRYNGDDPRNAKSLFAAARYLEWAAETGEQEFLWDNLRATQFLLRRNEPNILPDLDPRLWGRDELGAGIKSLEQWIPDLPASLGLVASATQIVSDLRVQYPK